MSPTSAPHEMAGELWEQRRRRGGPSWAVIVVTASLVAAVPVTLYAVETVGAAVVAVAVVGAMAAVCAGVKRFRPRMSVVRTLAGSVVETRGDG